MSSQRRLYLLYHELRPSGSRYSYVIENEEFEKHLDLFCALARDSLPGCGPR